MPRCFSSCAAIDWGADFSRLISNIISSASTFSPITFLIYFSAIFSHVVMCHDSRQMYYADDDDEDVITTLITLDDYADGWLFSMLISSRRIFWLFFDDYFFIASFLIISFTRLIDAGADVGLLFWCAFRFFSFISIDFSSDWFFFCVCISMGSFFLSSYWLRLLMIFFFSDFSSFSFSILFSFSS